MTQQRKPKGASNSTGGQFAGHDHSAPGETLGATAPAVTETQRILAEKLEVYGLTTDDVPGLAEAWDAEFAVLNTERPDAPEDVAQRVLEARGYSVDIVDGINYLPDNTVEVSFYHDHDDDYEDEDDWDSLTLTGDDADAVRAVYDEGTSEWDKAYRQITLSAEPWHVGLDVTAHRQTLSDMRLQVNRAQAEVRQTQAVLDTYERIVDGKFVSFRDEQQVIGGATLKDIVDGKFVSFRDEQQDIGGATLKECADGEAKFAKWAPRFQKLSRVYTAAQNLPEGDLKEYLVGERPEESYTTTEGTGRFKSTVLKTFRPTSDLTADYANAVKMYEGARKAVEKNRPIMQAFREKHEANVEAEKVALANHDAAKHALHNLGWNRFAEGEAPTQGTQT